MSMNKSIFLRCYIEIQRKGVELIGIYNLITNGTLDCDFYDTLMVCGDEYNDTFDYYK